MNDSIPVLLAAALFITARVSAESTWAYVPSSLDARSLGTLVVSQPPTEAVVSLIGDVPAHRCSPLEERRVFSISIPGRDEDQNAGHRQTELAASPIPEGARWPDSSGRIIASSEVPVIPSKSTGVRNPWEVRIHAKSASAETVFMYGGVVAGGIGGPVAILNGHLVKRGDILGDFQVAGILSNIVLLSRCGVVFVLPLGRCTTISTVTDG